MAKPAAPKRKPNAAFMAKKNLSPELEAVVGKGPMSNPEVTSKIWEYIKGDAYVNKETGKKGSTLRKGATLQQGRNITPDEKLTTLFGSKKTVDMMELPGLLSKHKS